MELRGLQKKPIWLWWGIERSTHRIVAWALGDRGTATARVIGQQLTNAQHVQYCTDQHKPYCAILPRMRHTQSKAHTHHIESMNNKLRCYLARLRRKTHAYSKSAKALLHSILFVWKRKFAAPLQPQTGSIVSPRVWDDSIKIPI
ncbi:IS1 family transposase [Polaromonas sp. CG_9.5]|uniref:IS1 family transposase n=1 Tax=Polaromonas sp. CG_9.5 TaxID=3071705 RepID=UPI003FA3A58E